MDDDVEDDDVEEDEDEGDNAEDEVEGEKVEDEHVEKDQNDDDDDGDDDDIDDDDDEDGDDLKMIMLRRVMKSMIVLLLLKGRWRLMMLRMMRSRGRKMKTLTMMTLRRRKMMMLRRRTDPKTGTHTLCEPAQSICTYRKNAADQNLDADFVRACAVKMHVDISQEPLYTEIYRKNAAAQMGHPDQAPAFTLSIRTPYLMWTRCLENICQFLCL